MQMCQTSIMGILKVVCVWCDCVRDCGLIIWGFNHLSIYLVYFLFFLAFYQREGKLVKLDQN